MLSSQLGRVILSGSTGSLDEMSAEPDHDGSYGPLDGLLEEVALQVGDTSDRGGNRRPENMFSFD